MVYRYVDQFWAAMGPAFFFLKKESDRQCLLLVRLFLDGFWRRLDAVAGVSEKNWNYLFLQLCSSKMMTFLGETLIPLSFPDENLEEMREDLG